RHALPLSNCGTEITAPHAGNLGRNGRRHNHGSASPETQSGRRAIPSGVGAHGRRFSAAPEFSKYLRPRSCYSAEPIWKEPTLSTLWENRATFNLREGYEGV